MFQGSQVNPVYGLTWWLPRSTPAVDIVTRSTDITSHAAELPADMVVAAGAGDQRLYIIPSLRLTIVRQAKLDLAALAAGKKDRKSVVEGKGGSGRVGSGGRRVLKKKTRK